MRPLGLVVLMSLAIVVAGCGGSQGQAANVSMRPGGLLASGGELVGCVVVGDPLHTSVHCRPASSKSAERGSLVTVFDKHGRTIAHQRIRPDHGFHFVLLPGRYRLGFGRRGQQDRRGCPRRFVAVRTGRTTHQNLRLLCDSG
jgi:hypothetical protein